MIHLDLTSYTIMWYNHNVLHNANSYAFAWTEINKEFKVWYINGNRHRLDGPAVEHSNGDKKWYIHGKAYNTEFEYWFAVQQYTNSN